MSIEHLAFLPNAHPKLSLYVAGLALCALVWASVAARRPAVPALRLVAVGLTILFFGTATVYLCSPFYEDHAESSMAMIAWLASSGAPVYPAPGAATLYSYVYGPLTFIFNEPALTLLGPSVFASKFAGFCAGIVAAACVAVTALRLRIRGAGLAATMAASIGVCSIFGNLAYWNRPDSFLVAASSAAVLMATFAPSVFTAVLFGLMGGVMLNLKLYAALFAVPPFVFALFRSSRPVSFTVVTALTGLIVSLAPFALSNVNLVNFLLVVYAAWRGGLNPGEFVGVVGMVLVCCGSLVLFIWLDRSRRMPRPELWAVCAFLAVAAAIIMPSSKIGGGPHHLLPLVPIGLWLFLLRARAPGPVASRPRDRFWVASGATVVLLWIAVAGQGQVLADSIEQWQGAAAAAEEARSAASDAEMRPVQVLVRSGVGLSGRVQPVFLGQGILIDEGALMEMVQEGLPIPPATLAAIRSCQFQTILLAAGRPPLSDRSYYHDAPLFNADITEAFLAHYSLQAHGHYFDVWRCKPTPDKAAALTQPAPASANGL